jgi:hypothetical protein
MNGRSGTPSLGMAFVRQKTVGRVRSAVPEPVVRILPEEERVRRALGEKTSESIPAELRELLARLAWGPKKNLAEAA